MELPDNAPAPRLCHIVKWSDFEGYGFNLHADKSRAGQYIGKVDSDSPAETAGIKEYDRIIEVNGVNIANENHKQVVLRIKSVENETKLLVLDTESDRWYKERNFVVRANQSNVIRGSSKKTPKDDSSLKSSTEGSPLPTPVNGHANNEEDGRSVASAESTHSENSTQPQPVLNTENESDSVKILKNDSSSVKEEIPTEKDSDASNILENGASNAKEEILTEKESDSANVEEKVKENIKEESVAEKESDSANVEEKVEECIKEESVTETSSPKIENDAEVLESSTLSVETSKESDPEKLPTDSTPADEDVKAPEVLEIVVPTESKDEKSVDPVEDKISPNTTDSVENSTPVQRTPSISSSSSNSSAASPASTASPMDTTPELPKEEEKSPMSITPSPPPSLTPADIPESTNSSPEGEKENSNLNSSDSEKQNSTVKASETEKSNSTVETSSEVEKQTQVEKPTQTLAKKLDKSGLNLNITVAEMKAILSAKKKFDPRKDSIDLKKKYQIIQNM